MVAGLVAGLRDMRWTAIKITQFGHGVCSANGESCDCETADHTIAVSEERVESGTDSGRYLAAGAVRSLWVRTRQGQLVEAMPRIRREFQRSTNTVVESNSILRFFRPDLFLSVLDPSVRDFKESARRYLDRADAILIPHGAKLETALWNDVSAALIRSTPVFAMRAAEYITPEILQFVRMRLCGSGSREEGHLG